MPIAWDGAEARIVERPRSAFLHGAAVGDTLAVLTPGWTAGSPAPLVLPTR
ncbi:hypothetical protein ACFW9M_28970 [Streptomyces lydicus]|uniref:hypothetical protein n=1 Tax=Streptomyces lydicus TaxID=47763 RepID=UPI0036BA6AFB